MAVPLVESFSAFDLLMHTSPSYISPERLLVYQAKRYPSSELSVSSEDIIPTD